MNLFIEHPHITRYAVLIVFAVLIVSLEMYFSKRDHRPRTMWSKVRFYVMMAVAIFAGDVIAGALSRIK